MDNVVELTLEEGREMLENMCQKKRNMSLDEWLEGVRSGEIEPYSHNNPYHSEDAQIAMALPFIGTDLKEIV